MTLPKSAQRPHTPRACIICAQPFNPITAGHRHCTSPECQRMKRKRSDVRYLVKKARAKR